MQIHDDVNVCVCDLKLFNLTDTNIKMNLNSIVPMNDCTQLFMHNGSFLIEFFHFTKFQFSIFSNITCFFLFLKIMNWANFLKILDEKPLLLQYSFITIILQTQTFKIIMQFHEIFENYIRKNEKQLHK